MALVLCLSVPSKNGVHLGTLLSRRLHESRTSAVADQQIDDSPVLFATASKPACSKAHCLKLTIAHMARRTAIAGALDTLDSGAGWHRATRAGTCIVGTKPSMVCTGTHWRRRKPWTRGGRVGTGFTWFTPLYLDFEAANHLYPVSPIVIGLGGRTYTQEVRR